MPLSANLYRQLFAASPPLVTFFFHIVGLEGWVLTALMDAADVSIWKREQEAIGSLSMQGLVSKTDAIV